MCTVTQAKETAKVPKLGADPFADFLRRTGHLPSMESLESLEKLARFSFDHGRYEEALGHLRKALRFEDGTRPGLHDRLMASISACEMALDPANGDGAERFNGTPSDVGIGDPADPNVAVLLYNKAIGALSTGNAARASALLRRILGRSGSGGLVGRKRKRSSPSTEMPQPAEEEDGDDDDDSGVDNQTAGLLHDARLAAHLAFAMDPAQREKSHVDPAAGVAPLTTGEEIGSLMRTAAVSALGHLLSGRHASARAMARNWTDSGRSSADSGGSLGWALEETARHAWLRSLLLTVGSAESPGGSGAARESREDTLLASGGGNLSGRDASWESAESPWRPSRPSKLPWPNGPAAL